jgi:hypothetical protein
MIYWWERGMESTYLGRCGDNCITQDAEIGLPLLGGAGPYGVPLPRMLLLAWQRGLQQLQKWYEVGRQVLGSVWWSTQYCQVSFSSTNYCVIHSFYCGLSRWIIPRMNAVLSSHVYYCPGQQFSHMRIFYLKALNYKNIEHSSHDHGVSRMCPTLSSRHKWFLRPRLHVLSPERRNRPFPEALETKQYFRGLSSGEYRRMKPTHPKFALAEGVFPLFRSFSYHPQS